MPENPLGSGPIADRGREMSSPALQLARVPALLALLFLSGWYWMSSSRVVLGADLGHEWGTWLVTALISVLFVVVLVVGRHRRHSWVVLAVEGLLAAVAAFVPQLPWVLWTGVGSWWTSTLGGGVGSVLATVWLVVVGAACVRQVRADRSFTPRPGALDVSTVTSGAVPQVVRALVLLGLLFASNVCQDGVLHRTREIGRIDAWLSPAGGALISVLFVVVLVTGRDQRQSRAVLLGEGVAASVLAFVPPMQWAVWFGAGTWFVAVSPTIVVPTLAAAWLAVVGRTGVRQRGRAHGTGVVATTRRPPAPSRTRADAPWR